MSARVRELLVRIGSEVSGAIDGIDKVDSKVGEFQRRMGDAGKRMQSIGTNLTAGITVPILGIGAAGFTAADKTDQAMNRIRRDTGATGEALVELQDIARNLSKRVPASLEEIAAAVGDLNTRLGLTGKPLEDLTEQFLNLARISGESVTDLTRSVTRLFGDWDVPAEKAGDTLDFLWNVSQEAAIGVGDVAQKAVSFGASLRTLGFSLEESISLFGKWEKEGVESERVMGSLRIAISNLAQENEEFKETFQGVNDELMAAQDELRELHKRAADDPDFELDAHDVEELEARIADLSKTADEMLAEIEIPPDFGRELRSQMLAIQEMDDEIAAMSKGIELFGSRAAADMVAAIREGRFAVDDFMHAIRANEDTVNGVAEETLEFSDRLQLLRNRALAAFEPLGVALISALEDLEPLLSSVGEFIQDVADRFANASPGTQRFIVVVGALLAALGPLLVIMGTLAVAISAITLPMLLVAAGMVALIAVGWTLYKNWDRITRAWETFTQRARDGVLGTLESARAGIERVLSVLNVLWGAQLTTMFEVWKATWESVKAILAAILLTVKAIFTGDVDLLRRTWASLGDRLKTIWADAWENILSAFKDRFGRILNVASDAWASLKQSTITFFTEFIPDVARRAGEIPGAILEGIGDVGKAVWEWFKDKMSAFTSKLTRWATGVLGFSPTLTEIGASVVGSLLKGLTSAIPNLVKGLAGIASSIASSIVPSAKALREVGGKVVDRLASGLRGARDKITSAAGSIAGTIRDHFPSSPPKMGPLRDEPDWNWMAEGMRGLGRDAERVLRGELGVVPGAFPDHLTVDVARGRDGDGFHGDRAPRQGDVHVHFNERAIVVERVNDDPGDLTSALKDAVVDAVDEAMGRRRRLHGGY